MAQYKYIGDCQSGYVEFKDAAGVRTVMPIDEPVEVPDWLAKKLEHNNHFEQVLDDGSSIGSDGVIEQPKKKGRKKK